jgi:hypothetical protein
MNGLGESDNYGPPSVTEADILHPPPSRAFVFIHMANLPYNQNFIMQVVDCQWVSMPETVHLQGDNLSFADGHCEHWTWLERNTFEVWFFGGTPGTPDVGPGDKDFARLAGAYSTPLSGRGEF